jgi:hypothetical protein
VWVSPAGADEAWAALPEGVRHTWVLAVRGALRTSTGLVEA